MSSSNVFSALTEVFPAVRAVLSAVRGVFPGVSNVPPVGRTTQPGVRGVVPGVSNVLPGDGAMLPCIVTAAMLMATPAMGQSVPASLVSLNDTLFRVSSTGVVETYPSLGISLVGLVLVPSNVAGAALYAPGDVLALEGQPASGQPNRIVRVNNARSGAVSLTVIGAMDGNYNVGSLTFVNGGLYVLGLGATIRRIDPLSFATIGPVVDVNGSTTDTVALGGLAFDGVARLYHTNNDANTLVTYPFPPAPSSTAQVGDSVGGGFYSSGLEWYDGKLWGAVIGPETSANRVLVGTFEHRTGLATSGNFTQVFNVAPGQGGGNTGYVAFAPCDGIDFNRDTVFPSDQDVIDFFEVLAGRECSGCNDIDFNNNGVFPEDQDVIDFFNVLAGGACP
jgi:hypothetical protein